MSRVVAGTLLSCSLSAFAVQPTFGTFFQPCICDGSAEEAISAAFTNRSGPSASSLHDVLVQYVRSFVETPSIPQNEKVILWSVMEMDDFSLARELMQAAESGVEVHFVTDGKSIEASEKILDAGSSSDAGDLTGPSRAGIEIERMRFLAESLERAGARLSWSKPEYQPEDGGFAPLMHEKVRIFARRDSRKKGAAALIPLSAYISTHNDTLSELQGDLKSGIPESKRRSGQLTRSDFIPGSFGNVQSAIVVRNAEMLQVLTRNFLKQESHYKKGIGRIADLPHVQPLDLSLANGDQIRMSFTFADSKSRNPNMDISDFINRNQESASVTLQHFVFSHKETADALESLSKTSHHTVTTVSDGHFAFRNYSRVRPMSGLFTLNPSKKGPWVVRPWDLHQRQLFHNFVFLSGTDKWHTKNSRVIYESENGQVRQRLWTGSLNLSANATSNKEVQIQIDSVTPQKLSMLIDDQRNALQSDGYLMPLAEGALMRRMVAVSRPSGAKIAISNAKTRKAFSRFCESVGAVLSFSPRLRLDFSLFSFFGQAPRWLSALKTFYIEAGASGTQATDTLNLVESDLDQVGDDFVPTYERLELMLSVTEMSDKMTPEIRSYVSQVLHE